MARVTVEDCLARVPNRFALTILASRRARALGEGRGTALVECDNKEGVTALREISNDSVRFREDVDEKLTEFIAEQRRQLQVTTGEHTFLEAASLRALEEEVDEEEVDDSPDVEELQSDPEALNKQAKGESEDDDEDADDDVVSDDTEESDDDDASPAVDDDDIALPDVDDDDADSDDEESESDDEDD